MSSLENGACVLMQHTCGQWRGALVARVGRKDGGLEGVHGGLQERSLLNGVGH